MDSWLKDLKVLDASNGIAGSFCARLLGRCGAEVLKVEPPASGDPARTLAPFFNDLPHNEASGLFLYLNSGKRSLTLDPTNAAGRRIFQHLVAQADVLVESFPPGHLDSLGLGYDTLSAANPGLIQISVSDFGQWGPYSAYQANDLIQNAVSGLMYPTGFPDQQPVPSGGYLPQFISGMAGVIAALAALHGREASGQGQMVDLAMLEVAANYLETTLVLYTYQGIVRGRTGSTLSPPTPLCDMYRTRDGYMIVTSLTQQQRQSLFEMIGHPELVDTFESALSRAIPEEAKQTLWDSIGAWLGEQDTEEAFELSQLSENTLRQGRHRGKPLQRQAPQRTGLLPKARPPRLRRNQLAGHRPHGRRRTGPAPRPGPDPWRSQQGDLSAQAGNLRPGAGNAWLGTSDLT